MHLRDPWWLLLALILGVLTDHLLALLAGGIVGVRL